MTRVLVVCAEPVGARMAGPAIRAYELARALAGAGAGAVTLAAPAPSTLAAGDTIGLLQAGYEDYDALLAAAADSDVVVAPLLPPRLLERIARLGVRLVADLYNPVVVEVLEGTRHKPAASRERLRATVREAAAAHLAAADLVLCASERQRDLWLGAMAMRGLLEPGDGGAEVVRVVPFGVPAEPPAGGGRLRGAFPAIGRDGRVLLWGGGVWDWLDAPTAIRALDHLPEDVHLVLLGVRRPALDAADEHRAGPEALAVAAERGHLGRRVHVNGDWVPYAQRGGWLLDADLAISAHHDHLETRFAFRTRLLDALWAGLPVVATRGDVLGERIAARGAGRTVAPADPAAFARACGELLAEPDGARAGARELAAELAWPRVVAPLAEWIAAGDRRPSTRARSRVLRAATLAQYATIAAETFATHGAGGLAARVGRTAGRVLRRT